MRPGQVLAPFTDEARCEKCGAMDTNVFYCDDTQKRMLCHDWGLGGEHQEHLHCRCRFCRHEWLMECWPGPKKTGAQLYAEAPVDEEWNFGSGTPVGEFADIKEVSERLLGQQPPPTPNSLVDVQTLVMQDVAQRRVHGIQTYGVPLQPFNGRDALVDAYEEALDLVMYLRQLIEERNVLRSKVQDA